MDGYGRTIHEFDSEEIMSRIRYRFLMGVVLAGLFLPGMTLYAAPKAGSVAPGFNLPDLARPTHSVSLKSLAGNVVLVDFWASWCAPCKKTIPLLGRLPSRYPGLSVVAISVDEHKKKALYFMRTPDTSITFLHDSKRTVAEAYDPGGMPSLFLIDRKGILRYRHDGYTERDMKKIEGEIKILIGES